MRKDRGAMPNKVQQLFEAGCGEGVWPEPVPRSHYITNIRIVTENDDGSITHHMPGVWKAYHSSVLERDDKGRYLGPISVALDYVHMTTDKEPIVEWSHPVEYYIGEGEPHRVRFHNGIHPWVEIELNRETWLAERVEYNEELTELWRRFNEMVEGGEQRFLECLASRARRKGEPFGGIYGKGDPFIIADHYEAESYIALDAWYWEDFGGAHILYDGMVLDCAGRSELALLEYNRASVYCLKCGAYWDYQGHRFEQTGSGQELEECDWIDADDGDEDTTPRKGVIIVDDGGNGTCPACGKGKLCAG